MYGHALCQPDGGCYSLGKNPVSLSLIHRTNVLFIFVHRERIGHIISGDLKSCPVGRYSVREFKGITMLIYIQCNPIPFKGTVSVLCIHAGEHILLHRTFRREGPWWWSRQVWDLLFWRFTIWRLCCKNNLFSWELQIIRNFCFPTSSTNFTSRRENCHSPDRSTLEWCHSCCYSNFFNQLTYWFHERVS